MTNGVSRNGIGRRAFIAGCGAAAAAPLAAERKVDAPGPARVRFGAVADCHYADLKEQLWENYEDAVYYRESLVKMRKFVRTMNARKVDFVVELGDFKDKSPTVPATLAKLDELERAFAAFEGPHYHVLGNHDTDVLTKEEFLSHVSNTGFAKATARYAFERGGFKFIVLDANYDSQLRHYGRNNPWKDSNVPPEELEWLKAELAATTLPVVVFCHQWLAPCPDKDCEVRNSAAVRAILEASGKVKAVIMGHIHAEGLCNLNGIRYHSVRALCIGPAKECCAFSEIAVDADGTVTVADYSAPAVV